MRTINDKPFEHRCSRGTVFRGDRCDLTGGVNVHKPAGLSEAQLGADFAEFAAWHTACIWEQLNGFPGWGRVDYRIIVGEV